MIEVWNKFRKRYTTNEPILRKNVNKTISKDSIRVQPCIERNKKCSAIKINGKYSRKENDACTMHAYTHTRSIRFGTYLCMAFHSMEPMFFLYSFLFVRIHNRHNKQTERTLYVICAHAIIPTEQCCCFCCYTYIWETQIVHSRYTKLRHNSYGILRYKTTVKNSAVAIVRSKS